MRRKRIVLCSPPSCRCPEVELLKDRVVIRDDFGGKVVLNKEQVRLLLKALERWK